MREFWQYLGIKVKKYRKIFLIAFLLWGFWAFGLGFLGGWLLNKGSLDKFPDISDKDRILVLAPHIDDETIGAAGVIQRAIERKAKIKIVYLTNGDDNLLATMTEEKTVRLSPEEFVALGQERMKEGEAATQVLGVEAKDLIFLGFPDQGLLPMFGKNFSSDKPFISPATKFNHNPYQGTYKQGEIYSGEQVVADLKEIISDFQPTFILVSHPRDKHPDHRAAYFFLEKTLKEMGKNPEVFAYLVHFPLYPPEKKLKPGQYLYPPKKLFSREGWFSFELTAQEENQKLLAMDKYKSQLGPTRFYDFLRSFVKQNEIFEEF
ncbi:MAG: PIG-L deacetylase family protein [Microgenomates group bacterium]